MNRIAKSFLGEFNPALVPHVIEFGKRVSSTNVDVLVLMARKAACFVDSLVSTQLATIQTLTTTDRVLDTNKGWLANKRIAIVDDAIISGTTLHRVRESLLLAGALNVDIVAFCVNRDYWSPELVQPTPPYLDFDDQATTAFCSDLVSALSVLPRPYSVDFPLFTHIRVPAHAWIAITTLAGWDAVDVSSARQRRCGVWSITLLPTAETIEALDRHLGWCASSYSQLIKLRLYLILDAGKKPAFWCSLLPVVAFDPIGHLEIDSLFLSMAKAATFDSECLVSVTNSPSARLRAVQYVIAAQLAHLWIAALALQSDRAVSPRLSLEHVSYLFPPEVASQIRCLSAELCSGLFAACELLTPSTNSRTQTLQPTSSLIRRLSVDTLSVQARLTQPFLKLYTEKELPARQQILKNGVAALADPTFNELMSRLNTGYSLPLLRDIATETVEAAASSLLVSLFLDIAIDRGIVVPVTRDENGVVYRAYRHGEDVRWSLVEERLACLMLESFSAALEREDLPRVWVEKLLVVMIRVGVHQGFLERWHGVLGAPGTAGVRFALKGAVVHLETPSVYSTSYENTLTSLLRDSGILLEDAENGRYRVGHAPAAPTRNESESRVRMLGTCFGTLLRTSREEKSISKALITQRELILLSSCHSAESTTGALGAEINIFLKRWERLQRRLKRLSPGEAFGELRRDQAFEAMQSASFKFRGFRDGVSGQTIERIAATFTDPLYRNYWLTLWPSPDTYAEYDEVGRILTDVGVWCLSVAGLLRLLELSLVYRDAFWPGPGLAPLQEDTLGPQLQVHAVQRIKHVAKGARVGKSPSQQGSEDEALTVGRPPDRQTQLMSDSFVSPTQVDKRRAHLGQHMSLDAKIEARGKRDENKGERQRAKLRLEALGHAADAASAIRSYCPRGNVAAQRIARFLEGAEQRIEKGTFKPEKASDVAIREIAERMRSGWTHLDVVDAVIGQLGVPAHSVTFRHALMVKIRHDSNIADLGNLVASVIVDLRKELGPEVLLTELRSSEVVHVHDPSVLIKWMCASGMMARTALIRLIGSLQRKLTTLDMYFVLMANLQQEEQILLRKMINDFKARNFGERVRDVLPRLPPFDRTVLYVLTASGVSESERKSIRADILTTTPVKWRRTSYEERTFKRPSSMSICIEGFALEHRTSGGMRVRKSIDLGIISIVPEETAAVVAALQRHEGYQVVNSRASGRVFYEGRLPAIEGYHSVVGLQQVDQGNRSTIAAYQSLRTEYDAPLIALVGIGGGIHKDVKLCDVVIADSVIYYDKRKVTAEGTRHRGEGYRIPVWMQARINHFFAMHRSPAKFPSAEGSPEAVFHALLGPIGSGEAVVADAKSEERTWLTKTNDKTLVLDTESGGLMLAYHEDQFHVGDAVQAVIIVRGLSDHADADKDDRWRQPASDNAMLVLERLMGTMPPIRTILERAV